MPQKPIRVFGGPSIYNGQIKFWATRHYKIEENGSLLITGEKFDVTNDIAQIITHYEVEFTPVPKESDHAD